MFYLVNLILAIVAMSYDDCQKREQKEIEEEYAAALVCVYITSSLASTLHAHLTPRWTLKAKFHYAS